MNTLQQTKIPSRTTLLGPNYFTKKDAGAGAKTFPSFPKLPAELRFKIWGYVANLPRTITLEGVHDTIIADRKVSYYLEHNAHRVPAAMHVCYDSRSIALPLYSAYSNRLFPGNGFYINYATDTLLLWDWWTVQAFISSPLLIVSQRVELEQNVKLLALGGHYCRRAYVDWLSLLKRFWSVDEVVLENLRPEHDDDIIRNVGAFHAMTLQKEWTKSAAGAKTPEISVVDQEAINAMRAEQ